MMDITGRDSLIITEALAFAYAAMKHLPLIFQPRSNMEDMRALLFASLGAKRAEIALGEAMLRAWNLRADVTPASGRDTEKFDANLRQIREQALQQPPGDPDTPLLVRHFDRLLVAHPSGSQGTRLSLIWNVAVSNAAPELVATS